MKKLIALMLLLGCGFVQAAIVNIDFDGASYSGSVVTVTVPQGFDITADNEFSIGTTEIDGWCPVSPGPPDVGNIFCAISSIAGPGQPLVAHFVRGDGTDFALQEMDIYLADSFGLGDEVVISAWDSGDALITQTSANVNDLGEGWHTMQFGSEWSGISRLSYSGQQEESFESGSYIYLDNIKVNVVPIPAAVWLFGSGLGLLGWIRRRKTA